MWMRTCFAVLLAFAAVTYANDCSASASLASSGSDGTWTDGQGNKFTTYDITIANIGSCDLNTITLSIVYESGANITSSWNLERSTDALFSLTNFGDILQAGATISDAGFVLQYVTSPSATISVASTNCASCSSSSQPTNAPTSTPTNAPTNAPTVSAETIQDLISAPSELSRLSLLTDQQFVFDFQTSVLGVTQSAGGKTVATSRTNFPAVIGNGVAMTVGFIEACGINLPHSHPRATEINFIVKGSFQAGFFLENGARFIGNVLSEGMATVFPQGAIHFELNLGCEPAMFVAAFNNEDPGVQTTASSFFGLPKDVVATSLNISSIQSVSDLAQHLPMNPAIAMQECMQRCGFSS